MLTHADAGEALGADDSDFAALYDCYRSRLERYCTYRLRDRHEAEDVVQEAFARAWRHRHRYNGKAFYPWLKVIASNLCTDVLRRRSRVEAHAEVEATGHVAGGEEAVVASVERQMLGTALGRLNDRHRQVLQLREQSEWSYEAIADHHGVSVATVESLLWRARQALRREFALVAGEDGRLAALPVIGALLRRIRSVWHPWARALTRFSPELGGLFGNAAAMAAIGAMMLAPLGSQPADSTHHPTARTAAIPAGRVAPPTAPLSPSASALSPTSGWVISPRGEPAFPTVRQPAAAPIMTASSAAARAKQDPVNAGTAGITVGSDPHALAATAGTAVSYVGQIERKLP
ncbi:MAG TPA: sigma-70 family RNA polymerase sigma factor [Acidimicrobiales bacterium]|nr:sigma-70 family RNA polymerase sigma factor [Acidimicrobiales bacterium]